MRAPNPFDVSRHEPRVDACLRGDHQAARRGRWGMSASVAARAYRGRWHLARAHGGAVYASLRLRCGARPGVAPHNSLRSLRSLRSDRCGESAHEARCARRPQPCAPRRPTNRPCRVPPAAKAGMGGLPPHTTIGSAKARPGRWQRACGAPRSTGLVARARSAPRNLICRTLFERSERSERSELCDGPQGRAPQGSRCAAPTASPKRCRLPGRAFAAPHVEVRRRRFALGRRPKAHATKRLAHGMPGRALWSN